MIPVTVIILSYNEALNIGRCVSRLSWTDDVVIVDSHSTDGTIELARRARPDVRVLRNAFEDFGQQRNWALDNAEPRHDWILFLDADEFMTPALAREIGEFVRSGPAESGAFVAGRNYFLGRWMKHCTFYPSYQLRLLKRGEVRYRKEGHGQREVTDGPLHYFRNAWRHEGFGKGVHQWIGRHNQYSTDEVDLVVRLRGEPLAAGELFSREPIVRRRALKRLAARVPMKPLTRFCYTYFWRRGFLDGYPGLVFCLLRVAHDIHIVAKIEERKRTPAP